MGGNAVYYFLMQVFFTLGFTVVFQHLFQTSEKRLMKHHWLQRSQLELYVALFVCFTVVLLRAFSFHLTGQVYWVLMNLHLITINYSAVMLESPFSFALVTVASAIVLASTGVLSSTIAWVIFAAVMLLLFFQHLRIRQFDQHPALYLIYPSILGALVWFGVTTIFGSQYYLTWPQTFMLMVSYTISIIAAMLYTLQVHHASQLNSKFARAAKYDRLTGFKNWNAFRNDIESRFSKIKSPTNLIIATFDIDHFKQINDQHGHLAGNQALIALTDNLSAFLATTDLTYSCYRTGGEEFTILFENSTLPQVQTLCHQWQQQVRELRVRYAQADIHLTVSIGLTQSRPHDRNATAAFQRADKNLYQSKNNGRDQLTTS
ncbi:Signal transduction diguanylate cyclase [Secundilactobacillus odoratitofui DSM 19909 = JCM 15043]|uniref:Signal transduction diguanylate cyclase n=2 Tax=Secundilactobacillus odoratitofui TaxID=480930 RepID=A0A0R1LSG6_9LACO|nr:GGDEF domain-containing protein [Secundilactobacillus odoratitofui]KRK98757.1 Signal transduction diguanylate cyclase [Secundilactobacillus odoratitofui DSM 19909 = JCM 15043]